jgi:septal ring factor EnvC (AmiA/AmiB activator)
MSEESNETTLTLTNAQKVVGIAIAIGTVIFSIVIASVIARTTTEMRLSQVEKALSTNAAKIDQLDQFGHPDHERRINKLEARADTTDKQVGEMAGKLDVCVAILERIERQLGNRERQ